MCSTSRLLVGTALPAGKLTDMTPFVFNLYTYEPDSKQEIESATLNLVLKNHVASKLLTGSHSVRPMAVNIATRGGLLVMKHCVKVVTDKLTESNLCVFRFSVGTGLCLLYTSPSPRDATLSRMPSSA